MKWTVSIAVFVLILIIGCRDIQKNKESKVDELGLAALKQYCQTTKLSVDDFMQPRIYADPKHDICIEYVTRLGVSPKHVFLLFIDDGLVVERQRLVDYESASTMPPDESSM